MGTVVFTMVAGAMPDDMYRKLDPVEEFQFRKWAHDKFDIDRPASPLWHPVVRDEWLNLQLKWATDNSTDSDDSDVDDTLCADIDAAETAHTDADSNHDSNECHGA